MSILDINSISILEDLKNYNVKNSPLIYVWDKNLVPKNRINLFYSNESDRCIRAFSRLYKESIFVSYKFRKKIKNRKNIINFDNFSQIESLKIGLLFLDFNKYLDIKNKLIEFKNIIDNNTIIYIPYLVNFDDFEIKGIRGVLEFAKENGREIKWIAINGIIKLYDITDNGYNNGVSFYLKKIKK